MTRFSDEVIFLVLGLVERGYSYRAVSEIMLRSGFEVSKSSVCNIVRLHGG